MPLSVSSEANTAVPPSVLCATWALQCALMAILPATVVWLRRQYQPFGFPRRSVARPATFTVGPHDDEDGLVGHRVVHLVLADAEDLHARAEEVSGFLPFLNGDFAPQAAMHWSAAR